MNLFTCPSLPSGKKDRRIKCGLLQKLLIPVSVLLLSFSFSLSYAVRAQQITINVKNASLESVFQEIKKQSGYSFIYRDSYLEGTGKVSLNLQKSSLEAALKACFQDQPLSYEIVGKNIVVKKTVKPESKPPIRQSPAKTVRGIVTDSTGKPMPGVTVRVKGSDKTAVTGTDGRFSIEVPDDKGSLQFSFVGYRTQERGLSGISELSIVLSGATSQLDEVGVVSTGYQQLPRERATGSFVRVNNEQLDRRVSTNVLDRLEGITSGMLFTGNPVGAGVRSNISIRGASTIFANDRPLVVLDNFEYSGDLSNLNPNDIENITVLKDAAAASIWGARSGNGVIVITTKKGRFNSPTTVNFNANLTIGNKPDLFYARQLSPADYIDMERFLFSQKYYDSFLTDERKPALSPAVELMLQNRSGALSNADLEKALNTLKQHDVRSDELSYLYRKSVNQQYALNLTGGTQSQRYYVSGGLDKNLSSQKGNGYQRLTLNASNTYSLLKKRLELTTAINYTDTRTDNNAISAIGYGSYNILYPYASLADAQGNAMPVPKLRAGYIDTVGKGKLLDWQYRPLDEIRLGNNKTTQTYYLLNLDARYKIIKGLSADLKYQYGKSVSEARNLQSQQTYYTRSYINQFSAIDPTTGNVTRPVPLGGILDINNTTGKTQNLRLQGNYSNNWQDKHELTAIAGFEIRDFNTEGNSNRYYGYNDDLALQSNVDYLTFFPLIYGSSRQQILPNRFLTSLTDRYRSFYANASYTYLQKYTLSGSARKDESNLFGVNTNQKGVPLWSAGLKWNVKREPLLKNYTWLSGLQLRGSFGYNGNVDKNVTAYLTGFTYPDNQWGQPYTAITNPPNSNLRWERIRMINIGADFSVFDNRISGSFEYYLKKGTDIMGDASLAPSTGLPTYRGNTANIKGSGIDIVLNSQNTTGKLRWNTMLLFSHAATRVTRYLQKVTTVADYVSGGDDSPIEGRPLFAIYSYRWAGLNTSGDPQGYLNGKVSTNWPAIQNTTDLSDMVYSGPANPTMFGSVLNSFSLRDFTLSFNLIYKFGYYFKRPSLNYFSLLGFTALGDNEFAKRWRTPGDESKTNVPAMIYPANASRDTFYQNAEIMVEKGDNIRLQDVQLSYRFDRENYKKLPFRSVEIYSYINNLGIVWRAGKSGIDPDANGLPNPRTCSFGIRIGM